MILLSGHNDKTFPLMWTVIRNPLFIDAWIMVMLIRTAVDIFSSNCAYAVYFCFI